MARRRTAIDPIFEFDAPKTFTDLSAPLSPFPPGEHDPWFDQIHPDHSKPSAELAKELADAVRKLKEKEQQVKDAFKPKSNSGRHRWSLNKENQQPADWREIVAARNKQLQQKKRGKFTSLKEMRATQEPFKLHKTKIEAKTVSAPSSERRKPLRDLGNRLNAGRKRAPPEKEMKDLQELLKKHNKKFKATHTYEPPQHSVRQVKQWERETGKSYYALSAAERVQANQEIAVWKQKKQEERSR
ncbi:hypothetical protein JG688_00010059 [Phytophthora aleatoria]|uniref:Uncharacterized protein n=1 Tax=Phytophthora aleatoria TaxID=2496075 RepID=A0A8J5IJW7_9STRA|nr:hypothetical protein PC120_g18504 [Phytophthora cactorum]KAG3049815.1 hypothetical protein PC121_g18721 [Phytophthora cactorum]KAG3162570.1 hypothetical protein PC128_g20571 [Phytophthora cactorum]KAG6959474.1 hypothetical protein JG688_00010059 [Phytophthora aleatoria]